MTSTDGNGPPDPVEFAAEDDKRADDDHYSQGPLLRGSYAVGLVLILLGVFFLAAQWVPGLRPWMSIERSWPLIIIGVAAMLAVIGLATGETDMAIPVFIVGGIGGLLYWQNLTFNWASWAWAWTLIPGFVGAGMIVAAFLRGIRGRRASNMLAGGIWNILSSLMLLAIFGSFLGGPPWLTRYWPVGVILLGLWVLVRPARRHAWEGRRYRGD